MSPMGVVVAWDCAMEMVFTATNMVWSTAMEYYRRVPQTFFTSSVD